LAARVTPPLAWVLNFEVERGFASPGYTPSNAVRAKLATLAAELRDLVREEDLVVDATTHPGAARGLRGLAWSPTPGALALLARAGAGVPDAPPLEVLTRVNSRKFSAELGQTLPGAQFVQNEAALKAVLASASAEALCLKEAFSTSGSGRRIVAVGALSPDNEAWARRALRHGLQIEPWVSRLGDYAIHGYVDASARLTLGVPCKQHLSKDGRWQRSERAASGDLNETERRALYAEAERVADALRSVGYHGPFNLDAFRYVTQDGPAFNARCEINARYTMGWAIGMNGSRPDLE